MGKSLLFFELLQIAVGTLYDLSFIPSVMEWGEAFDSAKKQALVGVCFKGGNVLSSMIIARWLICRQKQKCNGLPLLLKFRVAMR